MNKLNEKKAKIYLKIISNVLLGENFSKKGTFKELCDKLIINIDTIKSNQKVKTGNGDSDGGCIIKKGMVEEYDGYDVRIPEYKFFQQKSEKEWVIHAGIHEFCHACTNILNLVYSKNENGIIVGKELRKNTNGLIKTTDVKTGEFCSQHFYFKLFNETMMDIMTMIAIEHDITKTDKIKDVLTGDIINYNSYFGNFIPLTLLYISAFSNTTNPNYIDAINNENGMVFDEIITDKRQSLYANDFIYGSFCDPLSIEIEFDKYVKKGIFSEISKTMDLYYIKRLNNYDSNFVKYNIKNLVCFLDSKMKDYINREIFTEEYANNIIDNFSIQLNKVLQFYNVELIEKEIQSIKEKGIKISQNSIGTIGLK